MYTREAGGGNHPNNIDGGTDYGCTIFSWLTFLKHATIGRLSNIICVDTRKLYRHGTWMYCNIALVVELTVKKHKLKMQGFVSSGGKDIFTSRQKYWKSDCSAERTCSE